MRAINDAVEGADAFAKMMGKVTQRLSAQNPTPARATDPEVESWNEQVVRRKAEKKARKLQRSGR